MQYFREINAEKRKLEANISLLEELLERYVHTAFYNNLDVILGQRHPLDPQKAYEQTVVKEYGGMCIDNNLSFYHMLKNLGFNAHLTEGFSQHYNEHPMSFAHSAHMLIVVTIKDEQYVVDPGFGNPARKPLPLSGEPVEHAMGTFKVVPTDNDHFGVAKLFDDYIVQYTFDPKNVMTCANFNPHLDYIHSSESVFRQTLFMTKSLPDRVISIMNGDFKTEYADGTEEKCDVIAKGGLRRVMLEVFGLPHEYVDRVDWEKASALHETKAKLRKLWQPQHIRISFNGDTTATVLEYPQQKTFKMI